MTRTLLLLGLLAAPAWAQEPSLRVTGYGEFAVSREVGVRDPATVEGADRVRLLDGVTLLDQTDRIEARLCRTFGVTYVAAGLPPGTVLPLVAESAHPALTHPDGRVSTGVRYHTAVQAGRPGYTGFTFDEPWELAEGIWTFRVSYGGQVLAEQSFTVTVPPDAVQGPAGGCGRPTS